MPVLELADTSKITGKTQEMLSTLEKGIGFTPNIMKQMANSPAALEAFLSSREALSRGFLDAQMIALIGIVVAETYSCEYLLASRVAMAKKAGISEAELKLARQQSSSDPKKDIGLSFVRNIVVRHASELPATDIPELKAAGYTDGEIVELIANTSLNMFVYYLIQIAQPELDFEKVALPFPV
jgi:alkylhydroperoxidase family enzyme